MKHIQEINNKVYYLQFEPFVHINLNDKFCFFYNTINKDSLMVNKPLIVEFVKESLKQENFRILECSKELLSNKFFLDFVETLKNKQMGNIIVREYKEKKPFQIPPEIVIERDINTYNSKDTDLIDDVKKYIHNIIITINNGDSTVEKTIYYNSYKQFDSPYNDTDVYKELPINQIIKLVKQLDYLPRKIIINGGNIFSYSDFDQLIDFFNKIETTIVYQIDINDFILNRSKISCFNKENSLLRVYLSSISEGGIIEEIKNVKNISFHFIISDIGDFLDFSKIVEKENVNNYSFHPYYNEENLIFFKNNIFVDFEDIISQNENIKTIESKAKFNSKLFGNVYLDHLGYISLHPTSYKIGQITDDIYMQIFNEFIKNKKNVWFLTRKDIKPCRNCNFALLCPAISGYELYSKKYDFCKIKK